MLAYPRMDPRYRGVLKFESRCLVNSPKVPLRLAPLSYNGKNSSVSPMSRNSSKCVLSAGVMNPRSENCQRAIFEKEG